MANLIYPSVPFIGLEFTFGSSEIRFFLLQRFTYVNMKRMAAMKQGTGDNGQADIRSIFYYKAHTLCMEEYSVI